MKYFLLVVFVVVVVDLALASPQGKYKNNHPNVNIDDILKSDRLLRNYLNCLIEDDEKAKCTPEGADLKKILPEALETGCAKCEDKQREEAIKVIRFLIDNKRDWWNELAAKYDADGKYLKKYEEDAQKEHINV